MLGDQREISVPKNSNAKSSSHLFSTHQLTFNSETSSHSIGGTCDSIFLTTSLLHSTQGTQAPRVRLGTQAHKGLATLC